MRPHVALAALVLLGCRNDVDDLYAPSKSGSEANRPSRDSGARDAHAGDAGAERDFLPDHGRIHYDDRAACAACFAAQCGDEADACEADAPCRVEQACIRACRNPDCFWTCYAEQQAEDPAPPANAGYPPAYNALERCRDERCEDTCSHQVDRFGCRGEYNWRDAFIDLDGDTVTFHTLMVDTFSREPYAGVRVRLCSEYDARCENPIDETRTDAMGRSTLSYRVPSSVSYRYYVEYVDESGELGNVLTYVPGGQPLSGVHYLAYNVPLASSASLTLPGVPELDLTHLGTITLVAFECAGVFASGVTLEVENGGDEAAVSYLDSADLSATGPSGYALAANIEPGMRTVVVRNAEDGTLLARRPVIVRAGASTQVWVAPPDRAQLTEFEQTQGP